MSNQPTAHLTQQAHGLYARLCWVWPLLSVLLLVVWLTAWVQSGSADPALWWATALAMGSLLWGALGTWRSSSLGSFELHFDGTVWMWTRSNEGIARQGQLRVVADGGPWICVCLEGEAVQLGAALAPLPDNAAGFKSTVKHWLLVTRSDAQGQAQWLAFRRAIGATSPLKSEPPPII